MLAQKARGFFAVGLTPLATALARTRVSADTITVIGTLGTVVAAILLFGSGHLFAGAIVVTTCVLFDLLDGAVARIRGLHSLWGAFLDSTLDRIADGAIFGSLAFYLAGAGDMRELAGLAVFCLVSGAVVSYIKARAEGLGLTCNVGFAERAERLIIVLLGSGLHGLGLPYVLAGALWLLSAVSVVTVAQRFVEVRRQLALRPVT